MSALVWAVLLAGGVTSSKWSTSLTGDDDFRIVSYSGMCTYFTNDQEKQYKHKRDFANDA